MPIAFDSSGTVNGTTASLVVDITSAAVGAWCYCHVQISSNVGATTFTGWSLIHEQDEATFDHAALWRRLKATGDTTFTVSWTGAQNATAAWSSYTGLDSSSPDEFATQLDHTSSGTAYVTATQTPADATRWAAASFGYRSTTALRSWTNATLTQRQDAEVSTSRWSGTSIADSNGTVTLAAHSYTATLSVAESHGSTFIWFLVPAGGAANSGSYPPHIVVPRIDRARFRRQLPYMSRNRLAYSSTVPPTAWTQGLTATLTFTGGRPVVAIQRALVPTLTFAGATTKQTSRDLGAITLGFAGALVHTPLKALAGVLTFTGTRPAMGIAKVIGPTLTFAGSRPGIALISNALVSATLSFTGATSRTVGIPLTAALGFAGSFAKLPGKALGATLSLTGSRPSILLQRSLSASQGFTGAISKLVGKALSGNLTFTTLFDAAKVVAHAYFQTLTAALGFAGQENARTARPITAALNLTGQRPSASVSRSLVATLTFAGTIVKSTGHVIKPTLTFVISTAKFTTHVITPTLTFAGSTSKKTARVLTAASLTLGGNFLRGRVFGATLGFVGAQVKSTTKALTPILTFIGDLNKFSTHTLTGALSASGGLTKTTVRTLTDAALGFVGSISRSPGKVFAAALSLTGGRPTAAIAHGLTASLSVAGGISRSISHILLSAGLSFSGGASRSIKKVLSAVLVPAPLFSTVYFKLQVGTTYVYHAARRVLNFIVNPRSQ